MPTGERPQTTPVKDSPEPDSPIITKRIRVLTGAVRAKPGAGRLESLAIKLAGELTVSRQATSGPSPFDHLDELSARLLSTYEFFIHEAENQGAISGAAEWLLDNYYVAQQALRQVREDMPESYYRQLPKLNATPLEGYPRIYAIARELTSYRDGQLDADRMVRFVNAFQSVALLTIGELWALPTMLRMAVIERLVEALHRVVELQSTSSGSIVPPEPTPAKLSNDTIVANCIINLRSLETQDWKVFFESVSLVDAVLRGDPAGVYEQMDFETRDRYREVVEKLAQATGCDEKETALEAVRLAEETTHTSAYSPRTGHVGYYLLDQGRAQLEASLGYTPGWREALGRQLMAHRTAAFLGAIGFFTLVFALGPAAYVIAAGGTLLQLIGAVCLALLPASSLAVTLVNWVITHAMRPDVLPKLDLTEGIPAEYKTVVVIPALIGTERMVDFLLQQLELHYLSNPDPQLRFALLTDYTDAPEEHMPGDDALVERARLGIQTLNNRHNQGSSGRFYLFHRERQWNPAEDHWLGWERKRGKLIEFNRLLNGNRQTSFIVQEGDLDALADIKYVITLDTDTMLPRGSASRLIATLAHPLNRAEFDPQDQAVGSGYTVLQPRVEIKPVSVNRSLFTQVYSGDTGVDLYTLAVSDVYQDLFGEGIYVGKGIYDVAAFERSLAGRVPDNTLLSHDLFEGVHGRAGLVTDITLFEEYPPNYLTYAHRLHRWARGDWQLLPWLLPDVPHTGKGKVPNVLSTLDRWKILDNLRRSLLAPAMLAWLIAGWFWLPGSTPVWTLAALFVSAAPLITRVGMGALQSMLPGSGGAPSHRAQAIRWLLSVIFLPYEALLMVDAIAATLVRITITHKRLLQWTTVAHTIRIFGKERQLALLWKEMRNAPLLATLLALLLAVVHPAALQVAAPLVLLWLASPQIAVWIGRPIVRAQTEISAADHRQLRRLARRTWLYFEQFVGPDDHWLPPDHFQEKPLGVVAHRTSPTNLGLLLLSTLSAYDLGYLNPLDLTLRLSATFDGMDKLERYRNQFLNWYDTSSLKPLLPRYVSTVDNGNLAACLIALKQGLLAVPGEPVWRWQRWQGLLDTLGVLAEIVDGLHNADRAAARDALRDYLERLQQEISALEHDPPGWAPLLAHLLTDGQQELRRLLMSLFDAGPASIDAASAQSLHIWSERVHTHLVDMQSDLDLLQPWLATLRQPPRLFSDPQLPEAVKDAWLTLRDSLPLTPPLNAIVGVCKEGQRQITDLQGLLGHLDGASGPVQEAHSWCARLAKELNGAQSATGGILAGYQNLSGQAGDNVKAMDFSFLFDKQRQLFHIGYDVTAEKLDSNHYDLLASEARTASLVAIAKGDVPQSHWLHLDRKLAQVDGGRALLSWNGSMFEYLMPSLLVENYQGTLLDQTGRAVVSRQIAYAHQANVPWGISESGYYRFDAAMNYQYRGFGVPGLGLKRGLGEDLVITPYASILALPIDAHAVIHNIARMAGQGLLGYAGFYEAMDYTLTRLPVGRKSEIIYAYMAHHQGMSLLALDNYLQGDVMVRRFHADPLIRSVELLLHEHVPPQVLPKDVLEEITPTARPAKTHVTLRPWRVSPDSSIPQAHFLSNGRYGVLITGSGSGYSTWQDIDLTRWRADTTRDPWGSWVYVQDRDSGDLWSAGYLPTAVPPDEQEVLFSADKVEFRRKDHGISLLMEIVVAPDDDVEIRRITLTNASSRPRHLTLTSYGELVLAPQATDRRHQAFNKLFIQSEYLPDLNAMFFHRHVRSADEPVVFMAHMALVDRGKKVTGAYEGDRDRFLGRGHTIQNPAALGKGGQGLSGSIGATLDPMMALGQAVDLEPHATATVTLVTLAAATRQDALALANRYHTSAAIDRTFDQTRTESMLELRQLGIGAPDIETIQQLLSALLYPHPALRARPEILAANSKGQPGLWPYAISGDYPILLVRVGSQEELSLVREVFRAHAYWRNRQLKIDLVIVNLQDAGYSQELNNQIHRLITHTSSDDWLNRRGGLFVVNASQVSAADMTLLETTARVILDGANGTLARQLARLQERPTALPRFVPTLTSPRSEEHGRVIARPTDLLFDNGLGGFSPDGREYVIYLEPGQTTPAPWINVIANPGFGFLVSEAGSGCTWAGNSGENRLTSWRNDPVSDEPGEALYLRDEETAEIWSPTPLPAREAAPYLVRHGAGYSVFEHHSHGLNQRMRLFAAPDAPVKMVQLRLENTSSHNRRITATYYAEWVLGVDRQTTQPYVVLEFEPALHALLARNPGSEEFADAVAFLAASKEPHGLTASRAEFLGRPGSLSRPAALERIGLAGAVESGLDACAALQLHFDLAPGEVQEAHFILGQGKSRAETLGLIEQYQHPETVEAAWSAVDALWDRLLGAVTVHTPDPAMDILLNRWLVYQTLSCRVWGRTALYQSSGAFGFRDQLQDVMALFQAAPDLARGHILEAARHQFEAGDVLHWWHPPSGRGVRTRISDDLLWLPYVAAAYVTATGDETILSERMPCLQGAPLAVGELERYAHYDTASEGLTLYEHARRALDKGSALGAHGLPLMGTGDWNDGMNRVGSRGKGESVWLGWFLYAALTSFAPICERSGEPDRAARYRQEASDLLQALASSAWDGNWYRRAYYDDGTPLGSAASREAQIDSIAQSWAVLSGASASAQPGQPPQPEFEQRARQSMQTVADRLVRLDDQLLLLLAPPFDGSTSDPGYIRGYPPGIRENGGQYTHAAIWAVWAFAELGHGDQAAALFQLLNPISHSDTPDKALLYRVEPYVLAGDVYGVAPHVGRGGWTWYTGSAGWMTRLGLEEILGVHKTGDTLRIEPCIPTHWPGYQITYRYDETIYEISVENPDGISRGVRQVSLDGQVVPGGAIPLAHDGKNHTVIVTMGQT